MMTRKQFLSSALRFSAGALGLTVVSACSGYGSSSNGPDAAAGGNCLQDGTAVQIGGNHGHILVVSKEDVGGGEAKTYDIRGTATHTHSVGISSELFAQLAANHAVMTTSSTTEGHSHPIMVACA